MRELRTRLSRTNATLIAREATTAHDVGVRRSLALALVIVGACTTASRTASAQSSAVQRPMADVLLLVDTSGSMERMVDNTLPSANVGGTNKCVAGVESNPNRWGMLVQALTGDMQPFFSCAAMDRSAATGTAFKEEYQIGGILPYDLDYVLPYHRPMTGDKALATTCAMGPNKLPGGGTVGVGTANSMFTTPAGLGGDVTDFPDDALRSSKWDTAADKFTTTACNFSQTPTGQLDLARDYVRFALMTFDSAIEKEIGVNAETWPPSGSVVAGAPFLGQWSYRRDSNNTPQYNAPTGYDVAGSSQGHPPACGFTPFEVGARHWGAPPWEGKMIPFPAPNASLFEIQKTNEQIQKVLIATRPFGATPIDGMMDDARDYFWFNQSPGARGPSNDQYIGSSCREQFIVLLTDGAPNLDMRPACGVSPSAGDVCPYPENAGEVAKKLWLAAGKQRVTTFVIGFAVNGSSSTIANNGFPSGFTAALGNDNCKAWYSSASGGNLNPKTMGLACVAANPPAGSTAEACCMLNKIAYEGSGGDDAPTATPPVGPFFAEAQADIVLAFGRILATVTKAVSSRTVPVYTPSVYSSNSFGTGAITGQYSGSFIPNAQKPWSGEIARVRSSCTGTPLVAADLPRSSTAGDSQAINLATQGAVKRMFVTYVPEKYTVAGIDVIDGGGTIRPYYLNALDPKLPDDAIPLRTGAEHGKKDWELKDVTDFPLALDIDKNTCRHSRSATNTGTTIEIPALNNVTSGAQDCTDVVMGFVTAHPGAISKDGKVPLNPVLVNHDFQRRCVGSSASAGTCSITGSKTCTLELADCPTGEVCVPGCAPLGAIFRANLAVNGPPDGLLRDAGYQAFQGRRAKRRPVLYAATTDGLLHAFKAVEQATNADHELWSFLPPAVLPKLASNFPVGNQILLDGSPVVKDTVWDRAPTDLNSGIPGSKWHTTLVAGLGVEGGGYYALNVTDADCNATPTATAAECFPGTNPITGPSGYDDAAPPTNLDQAGRGAYTPELGATAKPGPHFLWQLTDLPKGASEKAKVIRTTKDGVEMVSLFGRHTGTPAITTVQMVVDDVTRQIGVAVLPGGIDGPPLKGEECARASLAADDIAIDPDAAFAPRGFVRKWATNCTGVGSAVPGRGVTIVRLDTGQIVRHFGRVDDIPVTIASTVVNVSTFDSPIVGTPVVYPQTIGATAQKIFVGDADGTLWRIDVSSTDPSKWKVQLFADLLAPGSLGSAESQPIQIAPSISLEPGGGLMIHAATGDQEDLLYRAGEKNFVWAIQETRPTGSTPAIASVKWFQPLDNGERVTGPMTVFDKTVYFATFAPRAPTTFGPNQCQDAGTAKLWGMNYFEADGLANSGSGGLPMWCSAVGAGGLCTSTTLLKFDPVVGALAGYLIPGVTLRATQACSDINATSGEGTGNTGFESLTPASFQLSFNVNKSIPSGTGLPPSVVTESIKRPLPKVPTTVNAWALVVD